MVQPVRLDDALHIAPARDIAAFHPAVDDHVVETEIDRAVSRNPRADPGRPIAGGAARPQDQQDDRRQRENHEIPVVHLPEAGARAVVAFVEEPAEAVHHPAVDDIGEDFHPQDGREKGQQAGCPGHAADIASRPRYATLLRPFCVCRAGGLFDAGNLDALRLGQRRNPQADRRVHGGADGGSAVDPPIAAVVGARPGGPVARSRSVPVPRPVAA